MNRPIAVAALLAAFALAAVAQTAFTYQGRLQDGGLPAAGVYDLRFTLYDAATDGTQLGQVTREDVAVENGLFAVSLDFGALTAGPRWVEIAVRRGDATGAYTPILPRHSITPSPFAITAFGVAPASVTSAGLATDAAGLAKVSGGAAAIASGGLVVASTGAGAPLTVTSRGNENAETTAICGDRDASVALAEQAWQSFRPSDTGRLAQLDLHLATSSGAGTWSFTMSVREGEGATGALLGSWQVSGQQAEALVSFVVPQPIYVVKDLPYSLVVTGVSAAPRPALYFARNDRYTSGRNDRSATEDYTFRAHVARAGALSALLVKPDGVRVGIGTSTPAAELDVNGMVRANELQIPVNAVAGRVLSCDAIGRGTWQALPAALPPTGAAGGDLAGTYPNPTIGNGKITDAKIASVDWSKVLNKPAALAPTGPAGGDLAGTYPNPTLATGAVTSAKIADGAVTAADLATDDAGLAKVSGGALSMSNGNPTVGVTKSVFFGNAYRQAINLYSTTYGIGVQQTTFYQRSNGGFAWYRGGSHSDTAYSSGGGSRLMTLSSSGQLGLGTASGFAAHMLHVEGVKTGDGTTALTKIVNTNGNGDSAPTLHLVGGANTPAGVLQVSALGTGKALVCTSTAGGGEIAAVDVAGNLTLKGNVSAVNLPAVAYTQPALGWRDPKSIASNAWDTLVEVTCTTPAAGFVVVTGAVDVIPFGTMKAGEVIGTVYLDYAVDNGNYQALVGGYCYARENRVPFHRVIPVSGPTALRFRIRLSNNSAHPVETDDCGLSAIYIPAAM